MKEKTWIKNLILAVVVLFLTVPTYFGFKAENEVLETACKMLAGIGVGVSITLGIKIIMNISINKDTHSTHIDDHSKHDDHSTKIDNSLSFKAGNSTNNGIQTNKIDKVVLEQREVKHINSNEAKHCEYIVAEMDALKKYMDSPYNDPLNAYIGRGMVNGQYYEGDYKNLYNLSDYLNRASVVFNDVNLNNAVIELHGAIAQLQWDLSIYTRSYGEGRIAKDRWSLYYLIYEHPYVYTAKEGLGEITPEVEKQATDQLHKLQADKSELVNKYEKFLIIYNKLL